MTEQTPNTEPITLPLRRFDGSLTGENVELDPRIFGVERNNHVLYLAVKTEQTNQRHGTRATLTKGLVSGGGKKPFNQKGRGTARSGSSRSPIWKGGGVIFGPEPHEFSMKLPRKVKQLARKIAFSVKRLAGAIELVEDFTFDEPKTKRMHEMLTKFQAEGKSALLLVEGHHPNIVKSCRNIPRFEVRESLTASTFDVLRARKVFITRSALTGLQGGLADV